jgi:hypothetical protein
MRSLLGLVSAARFLSIGGDQVSDLVRLIDLHKVPGVVEQMQLAAGNRAARLRAAGG